MEQEHPLLQRPDVICSGRCLLQPTAWILQTSPFIEISQKEFLWTKQK